MAKDKHDANSLVGSRFFRFPILSVPFIVAVIIITIFEFHLFTSFSKSSSRGDSVSTNYIFDAYAQALSLTKMSETGLIFLESIEELRTKPYSDQSGRVLTKWNRSATIGYGYLIHRSEWEKYKNGITKSQAQSLFKKTIAPYEKTVADSISSTLSTTQFDALTIFAYNIGTAAFRSSSVVKLVNNPNDPSSHFPTLELAWKAFDRSEGKFDPGLLNRRKAEFNLYTNGVYKRW